MVSFAMLTKKKMKYLNMVDVGDDEHHF